MTTIEVPYMPIDGFDETEVTENFTETLPEESNKPTTVLMPFANPGDEYSMSEELLLILVGMGMEKYIELFQKQNILLDTFLQLNEKDLEELGVTDPNDRETIVKNLLVHKPNRTNVIPYNQADDLKIILNVSNHLKLMQKYCQYVELQMRKQTWTDYRINTEESACTYLKAFTECAIVQSNLLKLVIYDEQNDDSLIRKILKKNQLVLPPALQEKLEKLNQKKGKWKSHAIKVLSIVGFSSLVFLGGKYLLNTMKVH